MSVINHQTLKRMNEKEFNFVVWFWIFSSKKNLLKWLCRPIYPSEECLWNIFLWPEKHGESFEGFRCSASFLNLGRVIFRHLTPPLYPVPDIPSKYQPVVSTIASIFIANKFSSHFFLEKNLWKSLPPFWNICATMK